MFPTRNPVLKPVAIMKALAFNSREVLESGGMFINTAALTITLEPFQDKPEGFEFGGFARGGIVTFAGTYSRPGTNWDKVPVGGPWYAYRGPVGWEVGGVTT